MLDNVYGLLGMVLGFSGLIFIHELGHFALAKWNGVRVHVFSLGMGPYIVSFTWRGTVYALSLIPIGGYVKMMGQDDSNPDIAPSKDKSDYRNKRPGQKAAILAAGAIFNVIFALFAFTMCYWQGMHVNPPRFGNIAPDRPLATAIIQGKNTPAHLQKGELLIEVNHVPVQSFIEAAILASGTPSTENLILRVERHPLGSGNVDYVIVKPSEDKRLGAISIGLEKYTYDQELALGFTTRDNLIVLADPKAHRDTANMPAAKAGLMKDDIILSIDDPDHPEKPGEKKIESFDDFTNIIRDSKGRKLTFNVLRNGAPMKLDVTPEIGKKAGYYQVGLGAQFSRREVTSIDPESDAYKAGLREGHFVVGFEPDDVNAERWESGTLLWRPSWTAKEVERTRLKVPESSKYVFKQTRAAVLFYKEQDFARAMGAAWDDLINYSGSVFGIIRGLMSGDVSHKALSGAVGIGQSMFIVASDQTFMNFLWFLGFISLNLGVLQFLPIPLLDGWHLLMLVVEKLKGKPVSIEWQIRFQYVGIAMIGTLLIVSFYNDITRMFGL